MLLCRAIVARGLMCQFFLADDALLGDFLAGAEQEGLIGLKGHAILGGCRASMYNSMAVAGVEKLTDLHARFSASAGISR